MIWQKMHAIGVTLSNICHPQVLLIFMIPFSPFLILILRHVLMSPFIQLKMGSYLIPMALIPSEWLCHLTRAFFLKPAFKSLKHLAWLKACRSIFSSSRVPPPTWMYMKVVWPMDSTSSMLQVFWPGGGLYNYHTSGPGKKPGRKTLKRQQILRLSCYYGILLFCSLSHSSSLFCPSELNYPVIIIPQASNKIN